MDGAELSVMKKLIALATAAAIVAAPSAALAGKKPKPYKSETISILASHPVLNGYSEGNVVSVTAQELMARCELPSTNGLDGAVFEIPADYQKINTYITAVGSSPAPVDVDIYAFDADCKPSQALNQVGTDESGAILKGTAFVFVHNYPGGPLDTYIELKPL